MKPFTRKQVAMQELAVEESLFTLGNGYLGIRGNFEEGYPSSVEEIRGSYLNGVYARIPVVYPESAYGFPTLADKQPRLFDTQTMHIFLDGERVSLEHGTYEDYTRALYFDRGLSKRLFTYRSKSGKKACISFSRMVSIVHKELFAIHLQIDYDGKIEVISTLNSDVENYSNPNDPRVAGAHTKLLTTTKLEAKDFLFAQSSVQDSGIEVACGVAHQFDATATQTDVSSKEGVLSQTFSAQTHLTITKYAIYTDSLRHESLYDTVTERLHTVTNKGWETLAGEQKTAYQTFWEHSDILLTDDEDLQMATRFAIFQLFQSVGKDPFSNISAKGLSGEGYEGHYFWDTEIYMYPYYLVTHPEIAKNLILFRYRQLPQAKAEAANLGAHRGAKFPWRTISGIECSAYFPAGQAQYHINADIAYSVIQYYLAHGDVDFVKQYGLEMLLEISLFFLEVGHFRGDSFCIDKVTGPDEYTAIVNNNYYTNVLVQHCLEWTVRLFSELQGALTEKLLQKAGATQEDLHTMQRAARQIYLPVDTEKNIALQDENFLHLRSWDPKDDKRPLLLHYHPLKIYSSQILKQADTVLAHFLKEEAASFEMIRNSYHFYESITTHDSSLSSCVYGMMACRIGALSHAKDYFNLSVYMDMHNTQGNTKDGLHIANLAGTSMFFIYGFAGLRIQDGGILLRPVRPADFPGYTFQITVQKSRIQVQVEDQITITRLSGNLKEIRVYDTVYPLDKPVIVALSKGESYE